MTRRRCILLSVGIFAVVVGVAIGVLAMLPPRPGVTKANFDRITDKTTPSEAEIVFGSEGILRHHGKDGHIARQWRDADGSAIYMQFKNGKMYHKAFVPSKEALPDKLRRWLHLPK